MKRAIVIAALMIPALVFGAEPEQDRIVPFGGIEWSDSFGQVLSKIKGIPGVNRVEVSVLGAGKALPARDLDVPELLLEVIKQWNSVYLNPSDRRLRSFLQKYFDEKGEEQTYLPRGFAIIGSPIAISGASFKVEAKFEPFPGFAILHPEGVVAVSGYELPLALKSVTLTSFDPNLKEVVRDIDAALKAKYGKFDPDNRFFLFPPSAAPWNSPVSAQVYDGQSSVIQVGCCSGGYFIEYRHGTESELEEVYRKHLGALQKNTAPDQKSKL